MKCAGNNRQPAGKRIERFEELSRTDAIEWGERAARVWSPPARRRLPAFDLRSNQTGRRGMRQEVFGGPSTLRSQTATEDGPNTAGRWPTLPGSTGSFCPFSVSD